MHLVHANAFLKNCLPAADTYLHYVHTLVSIFYIKVTVITDNSNANLQTKIIGMDSTKGH